MSLTDKVVLAIPRPLLFVLGGSVAATAAGVLMRYLRYWRWEVLHRELSQPVVLLRDRQTSLLGLLGKYADIAGVGVMSAYDACHALAMMDDSVLEALDFSSKLDLGNFNRLSAVVHDQFLTGSEESVAGAMERLEGYTAERLAAAHLAAQGHVVEFPDTPNQEGWDLLVDGHPLQVKCVMDPHLVHEHLEKFPDIPVLVNAEMAGHFGGDHRVIVDNHLSHADVADRVHDTVHGVDALSGWDFHLPVVTLALSAYREGKALLSGKVDFDEAVTNVARRVLYVGGGAMVGSKIGAAVGGGIFGPVGAVIGGILGAIAGALFGRSADNSVRERPLQEAKDKFNRAVHAVVRILPEAIEGRVAALERKLDRVKDRLRIGPWSHLWPTRRYLVYLEIQRRINEAVAELRDRLSKVRSAEEAFKTRIGWEKGLYKPGLEVCRWALEEAKLYHPGLANAIKELNACAAELKKQARRLS